VYEPAFRWVLADVDVPFPLGSANRELICLADSGAGPLVASWTIEDASSSCERIESESTETSEGVLEGTGEMTCSLPPQETLWVDIL
jgi:hypothetical protein